MQDAWKVEIARISGRDYDLRLSNMYFGLFVEITRLLRITRNQIYLEN